MSRAVFQNQQVTLYQGDCLEVLRSISTPVTNCVTSPPYFQKFYYPVDGQHGLEKTLTEYINTQVQVFREIRRLMPEGGTAYIVLGDTSNNYSPIRGKNQRKGGNGEWHDRRKLQKGWREKEPLMVPLRLADALRADGWVHRATLIWDKNGGSVVRNSDTAPECHEYILQVVKWSKQARPYANTRSLKSSILRHRPESDPQHGCVFPLSLAAELIDSCPQEAVIIDPYIGSGRTAQAALSLGRGAIGIDLDCSVAINRLMEIAA